MRGELISVIIPVYNVAPYLKECLDSVTKQTYSDLEIILIDDGSTDKSGIICDEYAEVDKRIKVIHQKNEGLGPARNAGLDLSTGMYITFVDSDDFLELDMLELLYKNLITNGADIAACAFNYFEHDKNDSWLACGYKNSIFTNPEDCLIYIFSRPVKVQMWGKLFIKDMFTGYRFENIISEDVLVWGFVCKRVKVFVQSAQSKYYYRLRKNSIMDDTHFNLHIFDIPMVWDKVKTYVIPYGNRLQKIADGNFYYNAYVYVLNNVCSSNNEKKYQDKVNSIRASIRRDLKKILGSENLSWQSKIACFIAVMNISFYKIICKNFARKRRQ